MVSVDSMPPRILFAACCPPLVGQTARRQVEEVANVEKANLLMAAVITVSSAALII